MVDGFADIQETAVRSTQQPPVPGHACDPLLHSFVVRILTQDPRPRRVPKATIFDFDGEFYDSNEDGEGADEKVQSLEDLSQSVHRNLLRGVDRMAFVHGLDFDADTDLMGEMPRCTGWLPAGYLP